MGRVFQIEARAMKLRRGLKPPATDNRGLKPTVRTSAELDHSARRCRIALQPAPGRAPSRGLQPTVAR